MAPSQVAWASGMNPARPRRCTRRPGDASPYRTPPPGLASPSSATEGQLGPVKRQKRLSTGNTPCAAAEGLGCPQLGSPRSPSHQTSATRGSRIRVARTGTRGKEAPVEELLAEYGAPVGSISFDRVARHRSASGLEQGSGVAKRIDYKGCAVQPSPAKTGAEAGDPAPSETRGSSNGGDAPTA